MKVDKQEEERMRTILSGVSHKLLGTHQTYLPVLPLKLSHWITTTPPVSWRLLVSIWFKAALFVYFDCSRVTRFPFLEPADESMEWNLSNMVVGKEESKLLSSVGSFSGTGGKFMISPEAP